MFPDRPLVSVVTPSFNSSRFLEETIQSVLDQDYPKIEYIVVDSYSSDETSRILRRYQSRLTSISAPPRGPAAAIHTGLTRARGEILAWLGSDDTYESGAIRKVVEQFQNNPQS